MATTENEPKLHIIFNFFEKATDDEEFFRSSMYKVAESLDKLGVLVEGLFMKNVPVGDQTPFIFMNYCMFNTPSAPVFNHSNDSAFLKTIGEIFQGKQRQLKAFPGGFVELFHHSSAPVPHLPKRPESCEETGYFITAIEPPSDEGAFENDWLKNSGAEFIQANIPKDLGLRRITLHKRFTDFGRFQYVLMAECCHAMKHKDVAKEFVGKLLGNKPEYYSGLFYAWLPYM